MSGGGAVPRAARVRFKPRATAVFGAGYTIGQKPEIIVGMLEENRSIIQVVRSTQNCMLASTLKPSLLTLSLYKKRI